MFDGDGFRSRRYLKTSSIRSPSSSSYSYDAYRKGWNRSTPKDVGLGIVCKHAYERHTMLERSTIRRPLYRAARPHFSTNSWEESGEHQWQVPYTAHRHY